MLAQFLNSDMALHLLALSILGLVSGGIMGRLILNAIKAEKNNEQ